MSLEALNSPPLVGALTAGCYGLIPLVVKNPILLNSAVVPFVAIKGINALAYGLSMYSVTRPGRYDGEASVTDNDYDGNNDGDKKKKKNKNKAQPTTSKKNDASREGMKQMGTSTGRTLVPPSGWAFIIWAPIFIGELVMVTAPIIMSKGNGKYSVSPALQQTIREITGPYFVAQLFQTLWAASFRAKYGSRGGIYKYISALNLAGIAVSLSFCHDAFTKTIATASRSSRTASSYSSLEYWIYFLPLSLHFGWTTAAALVNLNGMFALKDNNNNGDNEAATTKSVAVLGNLSVLAATMIGVGITWTRKAPVYGGVICWALTAVASGLKQRIAAASAAGSENNKKKDDNDNNATDVVVGIYGAKRQRILSLIGAAICASTAAAVVVTK